MKAHGKTSKLARALEKDLQGDQVVYKHFQEGKISISGDRRGRHSAVDSPWNRAGIWKVFALLVLLILSAAILEKKYKNHVVIKHPVNQGRTAKMVAMNVPAVTNNQNAASVSPKSRPVIATRMQVKIKPERSPCMLRESSYGTVTFSFDRELQFARNCLGVSSGSIYSWNDLQGITHFSTTGFPEEGYFSPKWVKY